MFNHETYKTQMKETKEDTNKWKKIPCSYIKRINMCILCGVTQGFKAILIKIPTLFT